MVGGHEHAGSRETGAVAVYVVIGLFVGALAWWFLLRADGAGFVEEEWVKPWATSAEVKDWHAEWDRRAAPWARDLPDPPGTGPVERATYWLSRMSYQMEVRRRGDRFVVVVSGVDEQVYGGGWAAFGEGRIEGATSGFAGAVATFRWSCLSVRFRTASDGVGRIRFTEDGQGLDTIYVAHEKPDIWFKAYGERRVGDAVRPERGTIPGQILIRSQLRELEAGRYTAQVRVVDQDGQPLQGAVVQMRGRAKTRRATDRAGLATVRFYAQNSPHAQTFSAGREGYYSSETTHFTGDVAYGREGVSAPVVTIHMERADLTDHADYAWNHPGKDHDPDDAMACAGCHALHYHQWVGSRHARMADNGLVQDIHARMRKHAPDAPDDCVGCHQPGYAAGEHEPGLRPRGMLAGNHCDLCHKVSHMGDLKASGVLGSLVLARPDPKTPRRPGGIGHVFASAPDATYAYMGAIYNPLFTSSHLCAGCHQGGGRWRDGVPPKLDTFEEWNRWAAAKRDAGREPETCQDCHMPAGSMRTKSGDPVDQFAFDTMHRDPGDVHGHGFAGRAPDFAAKSLEVGVSKERDRDTGEWIIRVTLENTGAGHKIPTGTWNKHVVVGVWARSGTKWLPVGDGERALLVPKAEQAEATVGLQPGDWRNPAGTVLAMAVKDGGSDPSKRPAFYAPWDPKDLVDRRLSPGEKREVVVRFDAAGTTEVPELAIWVVHRRGDIGAGLAATPFTIRPYDAPPEVVWMRLTR